MSFSYWEKNTFIKKPDIVIVGSGIVGLSTAYYLKKAEPNLHVLILERGVLPYGASTRNAGFACFGSVSELIEDFATHSEKEVFDLVEKRWRGLKRLRENLGDTAIHYEHLGGYEIFTGNDRALALECLDKLDYFNSQLEKITGNKKTYSDISSEGKNFGMKNVLHMISNEDEGQIDTGRMMKALMEKCRRLNVEILNGVFVEDISEEKGSCTIKFNGNFLINTTKVLLAVNGFAEKFLPGLDIMPARAQVLLTTPVKNLKLKGCFHADRGYYYFRNIGDRVLFGGGRNLDFQKENTVEFGLTPLVQDPLERILRETILPGYDYEIEMRWSGIMGIGKEKYPIVKKVKEGIYCAVRTGGMGIAIGTLIGEEAAAMIINE